MKRRHFLQNILAAGTVPALPGGGLTSAPGVSEAIYGKAIYYTRLWGTSVPEMYTSAFGLNLDQAERLFVRLVQDRVISAPNASGIARAVAPFFELSASARHVSNVARPSAKPALPRTNGAAVGRVKGVVQDETDSDAKLPDQGIDGTDFEPEAGNSPED